MSRRERLLAKVKDKDFKRKDQQSFVKHSALIYDLKELFELR